VEQTDAHCEFNNTVGDTHYVQTVEFVQVLQDDGQL